MKPTAYFYNLARGSLLDEAALATALRNGHIGGAGLDVFSKEPLPDSSSLWDLPNIQITPHAGGRFLGEGTKLAALFIENLSRYSKSATLRNVVIGKGSNVCL